jgi:hypothetical protein
MDGPTDVLEVSVVQELVGKLFHPLPDLVHADGSAKIYSNVVNKRWILHVSEL